MNRFTPAQLRLGRVALENNAIGDAMLLEVDTVLIGAVNFLSSVYCFKKSSSSNHVQILMRIWTLVCFRWDDNDGSSELWHDAMIEDVLAVLVHLHPDLTLVHNVALDQLLALWTIQVHSLIGVFDPRVEKLAPPLGVRLKGCFLLSWLWGGRWVNWVNHSNSSHTSEQTQRIDELLCPTTMRTT